MFNSDEYSYDPENADEDVAVILRLEHKNFDEVLEQGPRLPKGPAPGQLIDSKFRPTTSVVHPGLKFVPPKLDKLQEEDGQEPPWRLYPNSMTEYFNYGFTETVWEAYKFKQFQLRKKYSSEKINIKKRHKPEKK